MPTVRTMHQHVPRGEVSRHGGKMADFHEVFDYPATLKRQALRSILRYMRERAGLTQKEAVDRVAWSLSKLIRVETGVVAITPGDVRSLLIEYGANENDQRTLIELAKQARRKDVFSGYRADIGEAAMYALLDYESVARTIRAYEPFLIPGVLQTREYALELLRGWKVPTEQAHRIWEIRSARQEALWDDSKTRDINIVIREAALVTRVGSNQVMREQLSRLQAYAVDERFRRQVTLQVLRFDSGHPPGADRSLMMFDVGNPWLDDLVYLEDADGITIYRRDDPTAFEHYETIFWDLWTVANHTRDGRDAVEEFVNHIDTVSANFR